MVKARLITFRIPATLRREPWLALSIKDGYNLRNLVTNVCRMNRRILITCSVFLTVICVVLSVVGILGAFFFIKQSGNNGLNFTIQDQGEEFLVEPGESPSDPDASDGLSPRTQAEMELIQRQVIEDRGLEPSGTFTRVLFTTDQLHQHVLNEFLKDYSEVEMKADGIVLQAFGLLNADFDLYNFYLELFSENIAGFYDNETKEMVVVQGGRFGGIERLTYAHEYTHALQDQSFDIRDGLGYSEDACETDSERCAALQALLEGDATLSELNWFMDHATSEDRTDVFQFSDSFETPVLDSSPEFIAKDFIFPYEEGFEFVQTLYDQGGWDAVNRAYANPPVSTEQVLHPERYPHDEPIPVELPDLVTVLGLAWEIIDQDVMGEWYTYLILAHGLDQDGRRNEKNAAKAAEGWGGDAYMVYYNSDRDDVVMVFQTLWETPKDAQEFVDSFKGYARDRFGRSVKNQSDFTAWQAADEFHALYVDEKTTTWISTPDPETTAAVWTAITSE